MAAAPRRPKPSPFHTCLDTRRREKPRPLHRELCGCAQYQLLFCTESVATIEIRAEPGCDLLLAHPAFWALDAFFGANLRPRRSRATRSGRRLLPGLPRMRCRSVAPAFLDQDRGAHRVGRNILALILGFFVPYFQLIDRLAAGDGGGCGCFHGREGAEPAPVGAGMCGCLPRPPIGSSGMESRLGEGPPAAIT